LAVPALGQEEDVTYETETTMMVPGGADLLREMWYMDDATTLAPGQVDLRLTFGWQTASGIATLGDSDDDFILRPGVTWGVAEGFELFADVPVWLGDGGDRGPYRDGNYDTNVGFTWRIWEQVDYWPAGALQGRARIPTGDGSEYIDGELRLIMTNEYDSGIRSHFNIFAKTVNGENDSTVRFGEEDTSWDLEDIEQLWDAGGLDPRHFQYGAVIGLDGPLCGDGAVRWVLDYMNRSSYHYGFSNINMAEAGWEWMMSDASKLGMSLQIGLDHSDMGPHFGATVTYAYALTY
jgi:hypothetical protein